MPAADGLKALLRNRAARVATVFLIAQGALFYAIAGRETAPLVRPLREAPERFGEWRMVQEGVIEQEIRDVLRADDVVSRIYANGAGRPLSLFVAYFKTQRAGQAPHSPRNCLPGAGWVPSTSDIIEIPIPGRAQPIRVNRYVVARGEEKSVVLYWYQSRDRVVASEYEAKFYLVADSIRYRRSDTALIRVVSPVGGGDEAEATQAAIDFIQSFFIPLREHLPA